MKKKICPFCSGELINKKTATFKIGKVIVGSITFRGRLVCKNCKSICFKWR